MNIRIKVNPVLHFGNHGFLSLQELKDIAEAASEGVEEFKEEHQEKLNNALERFDAFIEHIEVYGI